MAETETPEARQDRLLAAAVSHVAFEGWSDRILAAAAAETDVPLEEARRIFPRGALDVAVAYHKAADARMVEALREADLSEMRFRDKIAFALRARVAAMQDREAVRRAAALFSLPHLAPEGARLVWGTSDLIWTTLGDSSDDLNWYSKRATLSAVWSAVLLFWLGDDSYGGQATDAFIERRIDDVMRIEKAKASPFLKPFAGPLGRLASMVRSPARMPDHLPGRWAPPPPR